MQQVLSLPQAAIMSSCAVPYAAEIGPHYQPSFINQGPGEKVRNFVLCTTSLQWLGVSDDHQAAYITARHIDQSLYLAC
ncbi:hypothetical protein CTTA_4597 [Comamonas testosteroni]|uniref:Uncharacterized protein n=1 Tax=Comamonas testosteroni TaxID=285 RepID=A0A5A7MIS8_COMTE|nr:hypothetical protein CTTA_4597 [Comamonas testosteroni]